MCINLYIEAKNLGSYKDYKKYYFASKKASCQHEISKAFHSKQEKDYYSKYTWIEKFDGILKFLLLKTEQIIWGYGESIVRLLITGFITILVFSAVIFMSGYNFPQAFLESVLNFFGGGNCPSVYSWDNFTTIMIAEKIFGLLYVGLFLSALYKYINRS